MSATVLCDDALAALRRQPDGRFAAVVTSPPYNLGISNHPRKSGPGGVARAGRWRGSYDGHDDALSPDEYVAYHRAVLDELFRVLRPDGLIWYVHSRRPRYNPDGTPALVDRVLAGFPARCEIIWDKGGPGVGFAAPGPAPGGAYYPTLGHESVFLLAAGKQALVRRDIAAAGSVWRIPRERTPGHPAPFPLALAARCIEGTAAPGPVLDPFCGSGSTLAAAARLGRECLGIDQSEKYCAIAQRRLGDCAVLARKNQNKVAEKSL